MILLSFCSYCVDSCVIRLKPKLQEEELDNGFVIQIELFSESF